MTRGTASVLVVVLFFILNPGQAAASQLKDADPFQEAYCKLTDCWKSVFPKIKSSIDDGAKILDHYMEDFKAKMKLAELYDQTDPDWQSGQLSYQLTILKQYLEECEILKDGPEQPRHLILVGHLFDGDGQNQHLVAMTLYQDMLLDICGKPAETEDYARCKRSLVVREDDNKRDLVNFLSMIGPKSLQSITYVGHGINNAKVLGPKNLLLPSEWRPGLKITEDEWRHTNIGMMYSRDVDEYAPLFKRVLAPGAKIKLFACNTGNDLGPTWKMIVGDSVVQACLVGMHFEYMDEKGVWNTDWENPVPSNAVRTRLVPDIDGKFMSIVGRATSPAAPAGSVINNLSDKKSEAVVPAPPVNNPQAAPTLDNVPIVSNTPEDSATRDIVLRLAINASDQALVDHGKRLVIFSSAERNMIRTLTKDYVKNRHIAPSFDRKLLEKLLDDAMKTAKDDATRKNWKRISEKLRDCIEESVRLYYN